MRLGMFEDDAHSFGPAMRSLSPMQRAYVLAMASDPFGNPTRWARAAGYSDVKQGAKVRAHSLAHNPKIDAAVQEYARSGLTTLGPMLAAAGLIRIARNSNHKHHFKALESIADRVGLPKSTEHHVEVAHTDRTGTAMAARIEALALRLGLDPAALLGVNAPVEMKLIDVTPAKE